MKLDVVDQERGANLQPANYFLSNPYNEHPRKYRMIVSKNRGLVCLRLGLNMPGNLGQRNKSWKYTGEVITRRNHRSRGESSRQSP
jgi:hypothetical protein